MGHFVFVFCPASPAEVMDATGRLVLVDDQTRRAYFLIVIQDYLDKPRPVPYRAFVTNDEPFVEKPMSDGSMFRQSIQRSDMSNDCADSMLPLSTTRDKTIRLVISFSRSMEYWTSTSAEADLLGP